MDLQGDSQLEVVKYIEKNSEDDNESEEEYNDKTNENDDEEYHVVYVVDECSSLRHKILCKSYYIRHKLEKPMESIKRNIIFSTFPPPETDDEWQRPRSVSDYSELDNFLRESKPGLRDSSWTMQIKKAYENSPAPMKVKTTKEPNFFFK